MKKTNLKKGILAIALATSFILGNGQSLTNVHAANEVTQEESAKEVYEDVFKELKDTYNSYLNLYDDYTYINSSSYPKLSFDGIMTKTQAFLEEEKDLTSDEAYKLETEKAKSQLALLNEAKEDVEKIKNALEELKQAKNKSEITVKACKILLDYPTISKNYGDKIRTYLDKSAKVIERANKILEQYGMN